MQDKILQKISDIHKSNIKFVIVSSGGGSNAIASLLKVPGACLLYTSDAADE